MITVTGLSKRYGSQLLFRDANLQLNTHNCYGIVGANGSGKSTLLRILNGRESNRKTGQHSSQIAPTKAPNWSQNGTQNQRGGF